MSKTSSEGKSPHNRIEQNTQNNPTARGVVAEQPWDSDWSEYSTQSDVQDPKKLHARKVNLVMVEYNVPHQEAARMLNKEGNGIDVPDEEVL